MAQNEAIFGYNKENQVQRGFAKDSHEVVKALMSDVISQIKQSSNQADINKNTKPAVICK